MDFQYNYLNLKMKRFNTRIINKAEIFRKKTEILNFLLFYNSLIFDETKYY